MLSKSEPNPLLSSEGPGDKGWTWATGVSLVAIQTSSISSWGNRTIAKRSREGTVPFCSSLSGQHLEYCSRLKLTEQTGSAQGHQDSQDLPCEMSLVGLSSLCLERGQPWGNTIAASLSLRDVCQKGRARCFTKCTEEVQEAKILKLWRFQWEIGKKN